MNQRRCLKIALRMNTVLQRELGQPVEAERMLTDSLYARDVLLVCDALRESELNTLAPRFRRAMLAEPDAPTTALKGRSGFSASRFLSSLFGGLSGPEKFEPPPARLGAALRERSAVK